MNAVVIWIWLTAVAVLWFPVLILSVRVIDMFKKFINDKWDYL